MKPGYFLLELNRADTSRITMPSLLMVKQLDVIEHIRPSIISRSV